MTVQEKLTVTKSSTFFLPQLQTRCLESWGWSDSYGVSIAEKRMEDKWQTEWQTKLLRNLQGPIQNWKCRAPCSKKKKKYQTIKLFPFFRVFFLICHEIFNLPLNRVLSKEKLKPHMVSMNIAIFSVLCNASLKCKYESIQLICRITKWHNSYFIVWTCICIAFLLEQQKCCTRLTQLSSFHVSICTHSTNTLPWPYW